MNRLKLTSILILNMALAAACSQTAPVASKPIAKKNLEDKKTPGNDADSKDAENKDPKDTTNPDDKTDTDGDDPLDPNPADPTDPVEPVASINLVGGIDPLNSFVRVGEITGWAVDKDDLKNYLTVNIYFDGDNKSGKKAGTVKANLVGSDDNNGGEHAFIFNVPTALIDSKPHKVYAYVLKDGQEIPLSDKQPYSMSFFKTKGGAAEAKFNEIGFQNGCRSCHSFTYTDRWDKLVQDGFTGNPWSESSNYLYEKVTTSHRSISGSQPCGIIKCDKIKEWWRLEFGQ